MPAFEGLASYQPAVVLLLGLVTFAAVLGLGFSALRVVGLQLPRPWREVAAALLGTAVFSLGVQVLAMLGVATRSALLVWWAAVALVGSIELWVRSRSVARATLRLNGAGVRLLAGILIVAAGINLLLAMAPLTKIDEIFYQVLPPARIVLEGELVFYLRPWEAAVLPQLGYPIAGAPLHALGYVDAPNVWSWCLGALLAFFVAHLVREETRSSFAMLLAAASVVVGLYPSVYHTTGGPHALGDLATASAVLALAFHRELLRSCSRTAYLALVSLCSMMAAFTKLSLVPLAGIVLAVGCWHATRGRGIRPGMVAAVALPWLVLYAPLCLWTLIQSGSPFGPMFTDVFERSIFDSAVQGEIAGSRRVGQAGLLFAIRGYLLNYPLTYTASILALALPTGARERRLTVASLLAVQALIIAITLPHQARFLSGLLHAALVVGTIQLHPHAERWLVRGPMRVVAIVILLVPWLGLHVYRAWFIAPIAVGIGEREAYFRNYIPLYEDLRELDELLPPNAVIFARSRLPLIYFPRPVYLHHRDLPLDRPAFALLVTSERPEEAYECDYLRLPAGCRLGDPVYTNPEARYLVYRTPGQAPRTGRVEVREILPLAQESRSEASAPKPRSSGEVE